MPRYDYQCSDCGLVFERVRKMSERKSPETEPCPECGLFHVKQSLTTTTVVADGQGLRAKTDDAFNTRMKNLRDSGMSPDAVSNLNKIIR